MKVSSMIDYYITDVTNRLPRNIRDDVGFELKALLLEELQDRSEGKATADEEKLTRELLEGFGHPLEVAARYRQPITIVDPVDSHNFAFASIVGVIVIWIAGLADVLKNAAGTDTEFMYLLRDWYLGVGLGAFWWPGFLVVCFAITARVRRRWPQTVIWRPRKVLVRDPDQINRTGWILMTLFYILGLAILSEPSSFLDFFWGGRAAPEAYAALSYAPEFYPVRAAWLFGFIMVGLVVYIAIIIKGRWTPILRRVDMLLALVISLLLVWFSAAGNIFMTTAADQFVKFVIGLIVFFTVLAKGMALYRELQGSYVPKLKSGTGM